MSLERLTVAGLAPAAENLVLAACDGLDALQACIGGIRPERPHVSSGTTSDPEDALGAYLTSLTVEGFRGIGPPVTVDFVPGPGLTVVAGRNGSGSRVSPRRSRSS